MEDLIPEEPLARSAGRRRKTYSEIAEWLEELRKSPGKSFRFYKPVYPSLAASIRKGESYGAQPQEFTTATRRMNQDGNAAPEVAATEHGVDPTKAEKYVWLYASANAA